MGRWAIVVAAGVLLLSGAALAETGGFRVTGSGEKTEIDPRYLPSRMLESYALFKKACTQCHSQDRIIYVLKHCKSRHSEDVYCENSLKQKISKMVRQPGTGISKEDGKTVFDFLLELRKMVTG